MSSGGKDPTQKPNAPTRLGFRSTLSSFRKKISRSVSPSNRSSQTIPDDQSSGSPVASRPSSTYITVPVASPGIPINTYTQTPSSSPSIVLSAADSGAQISAPLPGPATPRAIVLGPSTITSPPKLSPWEKAVQKLSAQDQKEFDFYNQDGLLKVLDDVLKAANEKRELCRERMWKITWNGKIIVLRDIADKTIEWVNKFKTLGNIIAQGDPVHAAIPWAPIRYLIEFIIKDNQKMGEMLVGIEVITNLLGRCAIYEELYLGTGFDTAQRVEDALIALYADMLTYMINAKHYYSENTAARIAWGVLDTDGPAEALVALQVKESKVFEESHLAEAKNQNAANIKAEERSKELQKLLNEFEMPISRIEKNVEALIDGLEDSKRGKILDWISTTPYSKYHRTAKKSRRQGTCEWLLNSNQFKQWQYSNASALLWLRGDPGAGKTTLTSMVVDATDQKPVSGSDETFAYFYCKRGEGLLNDPTEIMRSILRQLSFKGSGHVLHKPVITEYQKRTEAKTLDDGLGLGDCLDIIVTLINLSRRTTIIIDALDECNNESRHELFNGLRKILHDSSSLVKVFISSRNDDDIKLQFKREPNIYIEETHNATDIKSYINEELSGCVEGRRLLRGNVDDRLKELIISKLLEKAHGMFLWAELQIKELCALSLESEVREMLDNFPTSLEETYMEIYKRVQRKKGAAPKIAKNALMWVMCACRPLSPEELAAMLSQQTKGSTIEIDILLDVCCNFLKLDHQLNVVRFFHLSVEEFLEKGTIFTRLEANAMVAELSLSVLIDMDKSIQHTRRYSVFYWMVHVQRFSNLGLREGGWDKDREKIWDILRVFFGSLETPSPAFTYWIECFDEFKRTVEFTDRFKIEPLHEEQYEHSGDAEDLYPLPSYVASIFGFGEKIRGLWDNNDIDFNARNAWGESLLYLASGYGNEDVVGILLDKGADINAQGGEYGNALQTAACGGREKIVQTLLDRGAEINAQGGYYGNALQTAASKGHEKIVQTLLDRGAEINAQGGLYGNALQAAAYEGHEKIFQMLLDRGAEINAQGGEYGNALQAAAYRGHEKIFQMLLDRGAEINAQGGEYGNALQAAAYGGHEKIFQTLLDGGAEINAQGGEYGNALQAAASGGHEKIVQTLLDRGAEINAQGGKYGNALQAAASGGHEKIVQTLLDRGAEINAQGGLYGNALQAAASGGHEKIVQTLLDRGAEINAQGGLYGNALQAAALGGHEKIVQTLLDRGAEINAQGGYYGNALQAAALRGREKIVQTLLNRGAEINAQGGKYGNALQAAAREQHGKIVRILKGRGAVSDKIPKADV